MTKPVDYSSLKKATHDALREVKHWSDNIDPNVSEAIAMTRGYLKMLLRVVKAVEARRNDEANDWAG